MTNDVSIIFCDRFSKKEHFSSMIKREKITKLAIPILTHTCTSFLLYSTQCRIFLISFVFVVIFLLFYFIILLLAFIFLFIFFLCRIVYIFHMKYQVLALQLHEKNNVKHNKKNCEFKHTYIHRYPSVKIYYK